MDRTKMLQGINLSKEQKEFSEENKELYKSLLFYLQRQTLPHLFFVMENPKELSFLNSSKEFYQFLEGFLPEFVKTMNGWDDKDLNNEFDNYKKDFDVKLDRPRIKHCLYCDADLTEDFALALTADDLLNKDKVLVFCPKCNKNNYFRPEF